MPPQAQTKRVHGNFGAWYAKNKEKRDAYMKAYLKNYYQKNKEKMNAQSKANAPKYVEQRRKYREEHKEESNKRSLAWVKKNPDKANAHRYAWREKNRAHYLKMKRKWMLKGKYNMTPQEYEDMVLKQDGKCAICQEIPERKLHVDHNHSTREVRGLLCTRCNTAIGLLRENTAFLLAAIKYLS